MTWIQSPSQINKALRGAGLSGLLTNRDNVPKRRKGNSTVPIIDQQQGSDRKTRLSWELHPSLFMHDMMEELEALENSHYIASDQGGDGLKANGDEDHLLGLGQVQALFDVASVLVEEDEDEEAEKKTAET